jgi:NlpC/P60 family putative phage cell wall peptidase
MPPCKEVTRQDIVQEARRWIDTPYRHQASLRGAGADCLGLVRGIWRALYGAEPMSVPPYTPDWAEQLGEETLLLAARGCLIPLPRDNARLGDVMIFRMQPNALCKHIAVRASAETIIHAYWGRAVVESYLVPYWQKRHAFSFAFPAQPAAF